LDDRSLIKRLSRTAYQYWEYSITFDDEEETPMVNESDAANGVKSYINNGFGHQGWSHYKVACYLLFGNTSLLSTICALSNVSLFVK
jgi:hypothetical protein